MAEDDTFRLYDSSYNSKDDQEITPPAVPPKQATASWPRSRKPSHSNEPPEGQRPDGTSPSVTILRNQFEDKAKKDLQLSNTKPPRNKPVQEVHLERNMSEDPAGPPRPRSAKLVHCEQALPPWESQQPSPSSPDLYCAEPIYEELYSIPKSELRIILVGKTGVGKSATGNTILGKREFEATSSVESVTRICNSKQSCREGRKLVVVDTPGLFDTRLPHEITALEIGRCIAISSPGPHAIVLVLQVGRYTQEEKEAVEKIQDLFGNQAMKYMIVLFTRKDDLVEDNKTIHEHVTQSSDRNLLELVRMCGNRYCAFDNRLKGEECCDQALELIKMIDRMVEENDGRCYTIEMFIQADEMVKSKEAELKKAYTEMFERQKEELRLQFEEKIKKLQEEIAEREEERRKDFESQRQELEARLEQQHMESEEMVKRLQNEMNRNLKKYELENVRGEQHGRSEYEDMGKLNIKDNKEIEIPELDKNLHALKEQHKTKKKALKATYKNNMANATTEAQNDTGKVLGNKNGGIFNRILKWRRT